MDEQTWEQQQDYLNYEQWRAEQDWAEHNAAALDFETDSESAQQDGLDAERESINAGLLAACEEAADYLAALEAHPWLTIVETELLGKLRAAIAKAKGE